MIGDSGSGSAGDAAGDSRGGAAILPASFSASVAIDVCCVIIACQERGDEVVSELEVSGPLASVLAAWVTQ